MLVDDVVLEAAPLELVLVAPSGRGQIDRTTTGHALYYYDATHLKNPFILEAHMFFFPLFFIFDFLHV